MLLVTFTLLLLLFSGTFDTNQASTYPGTALELDGIDDYVRVPDDSVLDFGNGNFTVEYWVKRLQVTVSNFDNIYGVNKWNTGASAGSNEWTLNLGRGNNQNTPTFVITSGTTFYSATSPDAITTHEWHQIAGVRDGADIKLYVDGVLKGTTNVGSVSINNAGRDLIFGVSDPNLVYFSNFILDEVRIWDVARDQTQIQTNRFGELAGSEPGLVAYYKLDDGSGTTASDSAGSNDGTLVNMDPSTDWIPSTLPPSSGDPYADAVKVYTQGPGVSGIYGDPLNAIGAPDNGGVSLGDGGSITLQFTDNVALDGPGFDLRIIELGAQAENAQISVSDGGPFVVIGTATTQAAFFDISGTGLGFVTEVKIDDLAPNTSFSPFAGYDLDSVTALNSGAAPSKLTVTKVVVNDDDGTLTVNDFPLFVDGNPVTSGVENTFSAGAHTVSETEDPGYAATIGGDCASDGSITLAPGDVKSCTITNDDIASPKLTVTKVVVNDNGGTKVVGDIPLFVDGSPVTSGVENTFSAGAHTVSETGDPGYAATISGDCAADGTITLNPGDVASCTITNDDIDGEGPVTSNVEAIPNPVIVNTNITLTANVDDTATGGSNIASAEYSINSGSYIAMDAVDSAFDQASEDVTANIGSFPEPAVLDICVRGTDAAGNVGAEECIFLAVYDPEGGFVTGGGWIYSEAGFCQLDDLCAGAEGKANFGFVSKYKKGASVPTGNTEFNFNFRAEGQNLGLNFHSVDYDWLVVNQGGTNAQFKGSGTINGDLAPNGEEYKFMLWAKDLDPGGDDTFRIRIWYEEGNEIDVYDNGFDQDIVGNIKVHDGK